MTLYTKCVKSKAVDDDGVRASIMRYNRIYYKFSIWVPSLAPSEDLLWDYKKNKINWAEYERRFREEVIEPQRELLEIIGEAAQKHDMTLLCWEDTPEQCHRRLIAEEVQRMNKKVKIVLH